MAKRLPVKSPLACNDVVSSAPMASAISSIASRAWDSFAPRPAMMMGFSEAAIISTSFSTSVGSGCGRCAAGR